MAQAKILITGAAGYVASTLARLLIQKNYECKLIDNYYVPSNIIDIENVHIDKIDIRDLQDISMYDIVFHLAAVSGINVCNDNEALAFDVNVKGTYNLLKTLKGKIIFASTSAVYGEAHHHTITENHEVTPLGAYGRTKLEAEKLIQLNPRYTILRFSNIYGHGILHKRTVTDGFIDMALDEKPLKIHGDGKQRRDFVHINDVLRAYWQAMRTTLNGTYNIGGNEALSVNDIAELVIKQYRNIFGYTIEKRYIKLARKGREWHDFTYSSVKARDELGYEPSYSVSDEIRERMNAEKTKKDI